MIRAGAHTSGLVSGVQRACVELFLSPATKVFLLLCVFALATRIPIIERMIENTMMRIDPTPARAFLYGEQHFDARRSAEYDLARATYFFQMVSRMDPKYPLVNHELARIAFLHSEFHLALSEIDLELTNNPVPSPSSYYVRALIKGYMQDYMGAAVDYEHYFKIAPANWAGINDYSWVLLKADLPEAALEALDFGLDQWSENPWLLNNKTTALYELERYAEAAQSAASSTKAVQNVKVSDWLMAYPGNDPLIAPKGLAQFRQAVLENQKMVEKALTNIK